MEDLLRNTLRPLRISGDAMWTVHPLVFQGYRNEIFQEFLHQFVIVYINDILIYYRNQAKHR